MPEHLEFIDPREVAVAYLDQTLFVGRRVVARPRRQPMEVSAAAQVMAVVRIEMPADTLPTPDNEAAVVEGLLRSARRPGVSALQVDFDALESQRGFYSRVLRRLRPEMPPGMPLSITALASWCAYDRWLTRLPVDEAVPMLFRMGKEQSLFRSGESDSGPLIREPLCSASLGVSTDEPWPTDLAGKRLYVFHPRPWTKESLARVIIQASADRVTRNQVSANPVTGDQVTVKRVLQ
jgi:hypothetical protein